MLGCFESVPCLRYPAEAKMKLMAQAFKQIQLVTNPSPSVEYQIHVSGNSFLTNKGCASGLFIVLLVLLDTFDLDENPIL